MQLPNGQPGGADEEVSLQDLGISHPVLVSRSGIETQQVPDPMADVNIAAPAGGNKAGGGRGHRRTGRHARLAAIRFCRAVLLAAQDLDGTSQTKGRRCQRRGH